MSFLLRPYYMLQAWYAWRLMVDEAQLRLSLATSPDGLAAWGERQRNLRLIRPVAPLDWVYFWLCLSFLGVSAWGLLIGDAGMAAVFGCMSAVCWLVLCMTTEARP